MWLLNTQTYRLHRFVSGDPPKYGILSHRWGNEELSFSTYRDAQLVEDWFTDSIDEEERLFPVLGELRRHRTNRLKSKQGWKKVEGLCKKSRAYDLDWAWIDTVCIDSSSSAELQEAINSMYTWYQNAVKCFVYMNDVVADQVHGSRRGKEYFKGSGWFTRGWTLQELLAPAFGRILFLDKAWGDIGSDEDLVDDVSDTTGIPSSILRCKTPAVRKDKILVCSIAQRMSWAAKRDVTRAEDMAYSLIGIFGVNMTMLYGEGGVSAFRRLQLEIIKDLADETVLAWDCAEPIQSTMEAFAQSTADFERSGNYERMRGHHTADEHRMRGALATPRGLVVQLLMFDREKKERLPRALRDSPDWTTRFAMLLCSHDATNDRIDYIVFMQLVHWMGNEFIRHKGLFVVRLRPEDWERVKKCGTLEQVCIRSSKSLKYQI